MTQAITIAAVTGQAERLRLARGVLDGAAAHTVGDQARRTGAGRRTLVCVGARVCGVVSLTRQV
jgi:hypothetical protein